MSSYFFQQSEKNTSNAIYIEAIERCAEENKKMIYVIDRPLTDQKYSYSYKQAIIILSPKHKILVLNYGSNNDAFENYIEDVIEDIGSISDKYLYKDVIGRPRKWRQELIRVEKTDDDLNFPILYGQLEVSDDQTIKQLDLLISLFIGSINNIDRVKDNIPSNPLDKVKQKIQLFDGDQSRFVYQKPEKKRITIQGLSGTGKTELLLHKLKDLYTAESSSKIFFTCHNRILAHNLKKRIPDFFNFMKVEQQILWEKRLWCTNAWGNASNPNSGVYSYLCDYYKIPFFRYSQMTFSSACEQALIEIKSKYQESEMDYAFTYMFIDESQDFDENFFSLCEEVTEQRVYIAGDIFQSIFDENISQIIEPDFLLGKCYRTDPKTLMFAHALGMGLFEENKLRWLEEQEWKDCGYTVNRENDELILSREPLRRFEDLEENFESIKIQNISKKFSDAVIEVIHEIINEHPTVQPDDIGVIFLDVENDIYEIANVLEIKIYQHFQWIVNKAYESKEKIQGSILLSNRNNVKGLEFPFVICVTKRFTNNYSYRNSVYTMLTRSFIKSYLLITASRYSGLTESMRSGLQEIITQKQMRIHEPTEEEKNKIRTRFKSGYSNLSHYDLMMKIFKDLKVPKKNHEKLFHATQQMEMTESDIDILTQFVKDNLKYIK